MTATCATCKHWQPRESAGMAQHRLCRCALGPTYRYLPPHGTCGRHKAIDQATAAQRIEWVSKHSATKKEPT